MDKFVDLVKEKFEDASLVLKAYDFACEAHKNDKRKSGEPYVIHPINVAKILTEYGLDQTTVAAALLHDVVEDTPVSFKKIKEEFGTEVEMLVKGVSKISSIKYSKEVIELDSLRRLFIAMSKDIRVILIKLVDRLHNIRTVQYLKPEKQIKFCTETMNLFVPLAERLGIDVIKLELENTCFKYLNPVEYQKIKGELDKKQEKNLERMGQIKSRLEEQLSKANIDASVLTRFKRIYTLYKKLRAKGTAKAYAVIGIRVIVNSMEECYKTLGEIHKIYKPVPGQIKDYIASPKINGYKSLHTTVISEDGTPFEVQIRTKTMHELCEYGVLAYWGGKLGSKKDKVLKDKVAWIKSIIQDEKEIKDSENFVEALQKDFASTAEIWVFTPKNKPISLPEKSTPIDMAYAIHTDLGNTCVGAKVNGKKVPLNYILDTGDVVEIITSPQSKGPSRDWLKIAVSGTARTHIRTFFKKNIVPENVAVGKLILEGKAEDMEIPISICLSKAVLEEVKHKYLIYSLDDMFSSIAMGGIKVNDILNIAISKWKKEEQVEIQKKNDCPILLNGREVDIVKLARCCTPVPGDEISAIASNNGVTVHCADCVNLRDIADDRRLSVSWKDDIDKTFEVSLRVGGKDEVGMASKVSDVLYFNDVVMKSFSAKVLSGGRFEIIINAMVKDKSQMELIADAIRELDNVSFVIKNNLN